MWRKTNMKRLIPSNTIVSKEFQKQYKFRRDFFENGDKLRLGDGKYGKALIWGEEGNLYLLVPTFTSNSDKDNRHLLNLCHQERNQFTKELVFDMTSSELIFRSPKENAKLDSAKIVAIMKTLAKKVKETDDFTLVSPLLRTYIGPMEDPFEAKTYEESVLKELNSLPQKEGISKVKFEDIKEYKKVLQKFPVGTKLKREVEAGIETFEKLSEDQWNHLRMPWRKLQKESNFDVAEWMAGSKVISRGSFEIN